MGILIKIQNCHSRICSWKYLKNVGHLIQALTHRGRVTHINVSKQTITGSDNGLSPCRRQAIIWTSAGILLIRPLGTNFSEILKQIYIFSFKKMHLKMSSGKGQPFCLGVNVLMCWYAIQFHSYLHNVTYIHQGNLKAHARHGNHVETIRRSSYQTRKHWWWRHNRKKCLLLTLCYGKSPVTSGFPECKAFFVVRMNKLVNN